MFDKSICILLWGLKGGSLANYSTALAQGLIDIGVKEVSLMYVTSDPGSHVAIPTGVKLIPLEAQRSRWMPLYLAKKLRIFQPDYLITISSFISLPAIIGWILSGKRNVKLIVSQHSTMSYKAYVELKDNPVFRFQPILARLLYPLATGLHANSQPVLDDLLQNIKISMPIERTIATPNPVNLNAIRQYAQEEPSHPWLKDKTTPVIISVGRLAKQKNFPLLLEAFAMVHQKAEVRLIIFGEGPERSVLEQQITKLNLEDSVSLPGFSPNPWCQMKNADLFVLSSDEEPFGLVLVEAMVCELPIIATDAVGGGPKGIIGDNQYGYLVQENTPEALSSKMLQVLQSSLVQEKLIELGQERCEQFRPNAIAQQWVGFLQSLS